MKFEHLKPGMSVYELSGHFSYLLDARIYDVHELRVERVDTWGQKVVVSCAEDPSKSGTYQQAAVKTWKEKKPMLVGIAGSLARRLPTKHELRTQAAKEAMPQCTSNQLGAGTPNPCRMVILKKSASGKLLTVVPFSHFSMGFGDHLQFRWSEDKQAFLLRVGRQIHALSDVPLNFMPSPIVSTGIRPPR